MSINTEREGKKIQKGNLEQKVPDFKQKKFELCSAAIMGPNEKPMAAILPLHMQVRRIGPSIHFLSWVGRGVTELRVSGRRTPGCPPEGEILQQCLPRLWDLLRAQIRRGFIGVTVIRCS